MTSGVVKHRKRWEHVLEHGRAFWGDDGAPPGPLDAEHFDYDQDMITFSQAFRRLKGKTQIYPISENDHVRTRLSHSLEAGVIGHGLGRCLGLKVGLGELQSLRLGSAVKAACLIHDLGHPPLGHMGEKAIGEWFTRHGAQYLRQGIPDEVLALEDLKRFEGNAHAFRIVNELENSPSNGGFRLTYATLAGMLKYPWGSQHHNTKEKGKYGIFASEMDHARKVADAMQMVADDIGGWQRHPLAYLVEAADDICYRLVDLEDGIEVGDYTFAEYQALLQAFLVEAHRLGVPGVAAPNFDEAVYTSLPAPWRVGVLRSRAMKVLADHVLCVFVHHHDKIWKGTFRTGGSKHYGELLEGNCGEDDARAKCVSTFIQALKKIPPARMYFGQRKLLIETAYHKVISVLLSTLCEATFSDGSSRNDTILRITGLRTHATDSKDASRAARMRAIVDFVAGATDHYALGLFRQFEAISHGSSAPMPSSF